MSHHRANRDVLFIAGAGHSGSTLVGLVLGSHPEVFYAGEAQKTRYLGDPRKPPRKRLCKICGESCPIWTDFQSPPGVDLYESISLKTGRPSVVDSTKNAGWIAERLRELEGVGATPRLLYLMRDGRAVINSRVRKYPDRLPRDLVDRWRTQIHEANGLFDSFPHPKRRLHYEDFAADPTEHAAALCRFLEIDFRPEMLAFDRFEHHPLGGNTGTQYLVARRRATDPTAPAAEPGDHTAAYYRAHDGAIRLDRRWLRELPSEVRDLFEREAGELNRPFARED